MKFNPSFWLQERLKWHPALGHMRQKSVPQHRHAFWYTFGGFALFLLGLQFVTGTLLLVRYVPSAAPAADALSGSPLCQVRAIDSVVVVEVTDSTVENVNKGTRLAFTYSGAPETGIPEYLHGKSKIAYAIPKDSVYIVSYSNRAVLPDDTSSEGTAAPAPVVVERADVPKELRSHVEIVRDPATGGIIRPSGAYVSMEHLMHDVPFGAFIRSAHAYGANLMVACVFIHMLSVFLMKGYRRPRELMWLTGVALFAIVLGFGFTGYLLPWNTLSYYATRVGVGYPESFIPGIGAFMADMLRGGSEVTGETLTRMYAMHVVLLPLSAVLLAGIHMVVLQVHGVSSPVAVEQKGMNIVAAAAGAVSLAVLLLYRGTAHAVEWTSPWVILPLTVFPMVAAFFLGQVLLGRNADRAGQLQPIRFYWNFAMRDYIGWLLGLGIIVSLALWAPWKVDAIMGAPVDLSKPLQTPAGIHPDWYFMFMFQFLRVIPGEIAMMAIGAAGAAWLVIPFLDKPSHRGERSRKYTVIGVVVIVVLLALTWFGYQSVEEEMRGAATMIQER